MENAPLSIGVIVGCVVLIGAACVSARRIGLNGEA